MLSRIRQAVSQTGAPAQDSSEGGLVARVRLGDEDAFQSLFETYYATLCDFAQSYVHSPALAEELVQTVFLRIWEHRVGAEYQPPPSAPDAVKEKGRLATASSCCSISSTSTARLRAGFYNRAAIFLQPCYQTESPGSVPTGCRSPLRQCEA
jgi:hypothetical protein